MDRLLEREFSERANDAAVAEDRRRIEAIRREREWRDAHDRVWGCGPRASEEEIRAQLAEWTRDEQGDGTRFVLMNRCFTVSELRALPYDAYLRTAHWQAVRYRALSAAGWRCQTCNSGAWLQVHHRTYERLGEELLSDLTVLCADCHSAFHEHRAPLSPTTKSSQQKAAPAAQRPSPPPRIDDLTQQPEGASQP